MEFDFLLFKLNNQQPWENLSKFFSEIKKAEWNTEITLPNWNVMLMFSLIHFIPFLLSALTGDQLLIWPINYLHNSAILSTFHFDTGAVKLLSTLDISLKLSRNRVTLFIWSQQLHQCYWAWHIISNMLVLENVRTWSFSFQLFNVIAVCTGCCCKSSIFRVLMGQ